MTREEKRNNRKNKTMIKMTEEEFEDLLFKAELSKENFLQIIGYHSNSSYRWAKEGLYPPYIKNILIWAYKAKQYKNMEYSLSKIEKREEEENKINREKEKILNNHKKEALKKENETLKEEIKGYREIDSLYNKLFKTKH